MLENYKTNQNLSLISHEMEVSFAEIDGILPKFSMELSSKDAVTRAIPELWQYGFLSIF